MKCSVAISTYNGEKYIIEQLESIRKQTQEIDELVIIDDCSTDNTYEMINSYIEEFELKNWTIEKNQINKGWRKNFRYALSKCTGDIIFLCDQDDIWILTKVREMASIMEKHDEIMLLASNYDAFYDNSTDTIKIHGVGKNTNRIKRIDIERNHLNVMRPGCTYAIRKSLLQLALENDYPESGHDGILWRWAIVKNGLYLIERPLIKYRRHENNATISKKELKLTSRIEELDYIRKQIVFFIEMGNRLETNIPNDTIKVLSNDLKTVNQRITILQNRSLARMILFQFHNANHYTTFRNMLSDDIILIKEQGC